MSIAIPPTQDNNNNLLQNSVTDFASTLNKNKIISYGISITLIIFVFGIGFYFGHKTGINQVLATVVKQDIDNPKPTTKADNLKIIPTQGVYWVKANQEPKCPDTHPIKGKFTTGGNKFYDSTYKTYDKIKPDVCFVSVEFAKNESGFTQKF